MTEFDLSELSIEELEALQKDVAKAIKTYESRMKKEALAAAEAIAKEAGFTLQELVETGGKSTSKGKPAKYRHPEMPELTWSGRGRQPAWFKELVDAGTPQDDLLI